MIKQIKLDSCNSTQEFLKDHVAAHGHRENILVSTLLQHSGHGRGSKKWEWFENSVCFSFTANIHPQVTWQSLEIAVLLNQFFEKKFQAKSFLKWPNDLIDERNKKCAGILLTKLESIMIIGIGLNLGGNSLSPWGYLPFDGPFDKHQLSYQFTTYYHHHRILECEQIEKQWKKKCAHLERKVEIHENDHLISGNFTGLGKYGEAILKTPDGAYQKIFNGTLRY